MMTLRASVVAFGGSGSAAVFEHQLCKLVCGVVFAGFEPMHGDAELGCELAQRSDARATRVGFEAADVGIGDAFACKFALAEAKLGPALAYSLPNGAHCCCDRNRGVC